MTDSLHLNETTRILRVSQPTDGTQYSKYISRCRHNIYEAQVMLRRTIRSNITIHIVHNITPVQRVVTNGM